MYAVQAGSQLAMLRQELGMLRQVAAMPVNERMAASFRPGATSSGDRPPPHALQELLAARQLLGGDREATRQTVFRPSHNLPTRSLAEQACHFSFPAGFTGSIMFIIHSTSSSGDARVRASDTEQA